MTRRRGFALPLALVAVLVVSMLGAMAVDAALQDLRLARAARAQLAAEGLAATSLGPAVETVTDSVWLGAAPGSVRQQRSVIGSDTVTVIFVRLGGRLVRASAGARSRVGGSRGDAGEVVFLAIVADPSGALWHRRLPGWWWAPDP